MGLDDTPTGSTPSIDATPSAEGFIHLDGQEMYGIADVDRLPPFLMSLVSDSDHWMFISSRGGLTAGRVDEDHNLFPYDTDDLLHQCHGMTGPITLVRVAAEGGRTTLWEPFTDRIKPAGARRNLYKSVLGNTLVFEEIHPALGLTFRYRWAYSEPLGFVRTATLERHAALPAARVQLLDGLLNLLPAGTNWFVQHRFSCLMNAYTRCEVDPETGLGIFALTSRLTDKAEPAESLRAAAAWSLGLDPAVVTVSPDAIADFREGRPVSARPMLKGRRGAYLVSSDFTLAGGETRTWHTAADVHLGQADVEQLRQRLRDRQAAERLLQESIAAGGANLWNLVASADGLQATSDRKATAHHFANVLFNGMRGGVFLRNYDCPGPDFAAFVRNRNRPAYATHKALLDGLTATVNHSRLMEEAARTGDADLVRLAHEYLPLTFSRRHGDPSRPWNHFAVHVRAADGTRRLAYEGNWRDIFQNWEALTLSFPGFIESIIAKFVNASTADGFNPYRVTQAGIDWEVPAPDEPWANLGYWGDHQIVYLLKFLEASRRFHPGALERMLGQPIFAYANVPYRLRPYDDILRDSHDTIVYDVPRADTVKQRVAEIGTDGRLVLAPDGRVYHVCLAEKLLVSVLAKLSNLVPDGGIWMNTQRPEWNDGNNALVGNGVSMVTLAYLRRYLEFCADLLDAAAEREVAVSSEVLDWCDQVHAALERHRPALAGPTITDEQRKAILDDLGRAFGAYREKVYANGFSVQKPCDLGRIAALFRTALEYLDHAIRANRRPDGLYHAYNLLGVSADGRRASVDHLYEMLEGQVAALSSGAVDPEEAVRLLQALRAGRLYRPDQDSYLLYPDRDLPGFLAKNVAPAGEVESNPLLAALLRAGNTAILLRDAAGNHRFSADFMNAKDLQAALQTLARDEPWQEAVRTHGPAVVETFERVFNHRAFTGRSGTMYGYEGLGCIYWHMVAKWLLAVQECFQRARREGRPAPVVRSLAQAYYAVRAGLGFNKTATAFGAFPTDPYSHTPGHAGAQQPGMTGQVKEEILTRMGELGVGVEDGSLVLDPALLRRPEFLREPEEWRYADVSGRPSTVPLRPGTLAFTFCQTPVIYEQTPGPARLKIVSADGSETVLSGNRLDPRRSQAVFERTGEVRALYADIPAGTILLD